MKLENLETAYKFQMRLKALIAESDAIAASIRQGKRDPGSTIEIQGHNEIVVDIRRYADYLRAEIKAIKVELTDLGAVL